MAGEADKGGGGLTILHLSDIHVGAYHAFRTPGSDPRRAEVGLADAIGADLKHVGTVDALVISGDIVTHGKWKELRRTAHEVLAELCERLGVAKDRVYIVPGNHDYEWYEPDARGGMLRTILGIGEAPESLSLGHEVQFEHFINEFYGAKRSCLGEVSDPIEGDGFRLRIGLLDSCRITPAGFREYGCLTYGQIKALKANFDRDVRGPEIRVAVLHHHITPVLPNEPPFDDARVSVTLDAGRLIDTLLTAEVGLVMHGHQHYPGLGRISKSRFVGRDPHPLPERNLYVLSAGSAGASAAERWPDVPNTYTLVRLTPSSAVVDVRSLSPHGDESSSLFHANIPIQLHDPE